MAEESVPRQRPCASCPYRRGVPSGLWEREEYDKLPLYDQDTMDQPTAVFMCHQQDQTVCAGWLGHKDPWHLLAVRIGVLRGQLDESCTDYRTDVPLFTSGAAAAEHGVAEIAAPGEEAQSAIAKLIRSRDTRAR